MCALQAGLRGRQGYGEPACDLDERQFFEVVKLERLAQQERHRADFPAYKVLELYGPEGPLGSVAVRAAAGNGQRHQ